MLAQNVYQIRHHLYIASWDLRKASDSFYDGLTERNISQLKRVDFEDAHSEKKIEAPNTKSLSKYKGCRKQAYLSMYSQGRTCSLPRVRANIPDS